MALRLSWSLSGDDLMSRHSAGSLLQGIIVTYVFADILSKAVLSILPRDYFIGTVKSIVTSYRIVIIPLKDLLL